MNETCKNCNEEKNISLMVKDKKMKKGVRKVCLVCQRKVTKERRNNPKVKEREKEYREKYKKRIESEGGKFKKYDKEKAAIYRKRYLEKNKEYLQSEEYKEKLKERVMRYKESHKEKLKSPEQIAINRMYDKRYKERNKEKVVLSRRLHKAKRRKLANLLKCDANFDYLKSIYQEEDSHLDHFIPISWGCLGNVKSNLIMLRSDINLKKSNKNPFSFLKELNKEEYEYFKNKIDHVASLNNMTYNELEDFVNWCENNKRSLEDLKKDNTDMIELYKKALVHGEPDIKKVIRSCI